MINKLKAETSTSLKKNKNKYKIKIDIIELIAYSNSKNVDLDILSKRIEDFAEAFLKLQEEDAGKELIFSKED